MRTLPIQYIMMTTVLCVWAGALRAQSPEEEAYLRRYIEENRKGYQQRPCGFDFNRNGVIGEKADRAIPGGFKTIYVDADRGNDKGRGTVSSPYKTIKRAAEAAGRRFCHRGHRDHRVTSKTNIERSTSNIEH